MARQPGSVPAGKWELWSHGVLTSLVTTISSPPTADPTSAAGSRTAGSACSVVSAAGRAGMAVPAVVAAHPLIDTDSSATIRGSREVTGK